MEESWDEDSEARLTAANIVSRLNDIIKKTYEQDNPTNDSNNCHGDINTSTVPNTLSSTNTNDPIGNSHKKVRVSASFSGQSAINTPTSTTNKSGRTRFSVGTNDSPHTYIQKFHRRNSLTYQHNDSSSNHCVNQFLPSRFEAVVAPLTESSDSAPQHDNNNLTNTIPLTELSNSTLHHDNDLTSNNPPTMNIDAATGQPSTAAANESTLTSHEEYSIASSTDNV